MAGAAEGLGRVAEVLRFSPDLVIVCYWDSDRSALRKIVEQLRNAGVAEVLLRTPNPVVTLHMFRGSPSVQAGEEGPGMSKKEVAANIVALAEELPVVDHYTQWMAADRRHNGPDVSNPNKLWMRMSDALHPGETGHLAFFRELAPAFGRPPKLSWEF